MKYNLILHTEILDFDLMPLFDNQDHISLGDIDVYITRKKVDDKIDLYELKAVGKGSCYFSVHGCGDGEMYSFNDKCSEEHIFRQSPHDCYQHVFKIDGTAVPCVSVVNDDETYIFISDNPSHVDNYTTEHILPESKEFFLSSGDPGSSPNFNSSKEFYPYYHNLSEKDHVFRFIVVKSDSKTLKTIRRDIFMSIQKTWGDGSDSLYKSVCFSSNYMHLRKNETGNSDVWIVPGIEYASAQYTRDAFWQTFILNSYYTEQCYHAVSIDVLKRAEYPLFFVLWSYRTYIQGGKVDKEKLDEIYNFIMKTFSKHKDGRYCPDGRKDGSYRNWFDICCYEYDDCDSYSQSLAICTLRCLKELGYDIKDKFEKAIEYYKTLFNGEFVYMSAKKPYQALDFAMGDLLYKYLFNESFLDDEIVQKTYSHIMNSRAKTPYGVKITSDRNGDYLPMEAYGAYGYVNPEMARMDLGRYANGGSYHIYEMLFHIEGYLHNSENALSNLIDRLMIDLNFDGATHEYMHTLRGNGVKANQGWNACVYAIWEEFVKRGIADPLFFEKAEEKMKELN